MIIGRKNEQDVLNRCLYSGRPEFVAVYGRRRVGKTYLVREYFKDSFSFYATGIASGKMRDQLKAFTMQLKAYGCVGQPKPVDWFEAFSQLRELLESDSVARDRASGRRVVFLDELPWLDTARSNFKAALDYFWNGWASAQNDVMLIVCGSATSWIMSNLINDRGGFHNRLTRQIHLMPFSLAECEQFFRVNGIELTRQQMVESYMVFGGIPYYLNLIDRRMSLAQNIEQLCFAEGGALRNEYRALFSSLFRNPSHHIHIIEMLAKRRGGYTRAELEAAGAQGGITLTKTLDELEQCGFIRRYRDFSKRERGQHFQLIDPFTLFSLQFLNNRTVESWLSHQGTPGYFAWRGYSFELVCLLHLKEIKAALGITGVATQESAWRSSASQAGAQVDLVIDRADGIVNLCEMKCTDNAFAIDKSYRAVLIAKREAFASETGTRKAVHITMITSAGLSHNAYWNDVQNELTADDLFKG